MDHLPREHMSGLLSAGYLKFLGLISRFASDVLRAVHGIRVHMDPDYNNIYNLNNCRAYRLQCALLWA